jgi:hypothetical protein
MSKRVSFQVRGDSARMTVRALIQLLESALEWLKTLDPEISADWEMVQCRVTPPYRFTFANENANGSVSSRIKEVHSFAKSGKNNANQLLAPRLSEDEIESTSRLADVLGEHVEELRISSPGDPTVRLTQSVAEKVKTVAKEMRVVSHVEWTTIRGTLFEVTVSEGIRKFRVKHQLTGSNIPCTFSPEQLDQIKDALPSRVEVYGCARFNTLGQPTSIDAERIRKLPENDIAIDELVGINIRNGASTVTHVERVRSGDD